jgi:hypothetical protein
MKTAGAIIVPIASAIDEQKRKRAAKNKAQNRWRQNSKRRIEVSLVPINALVRKHIVEVVQWIEGVETVKKFDNSNCGSGGVLW